MEFQGRLYRHATFTIEQKGKMVEYTCRKAGHVIAVGFVYANEPHEDLEQRCRAIIDRSFLPVQYGAAQNHDNEDWSGKRHMRRRAHRRHVILPLDADADSEQFPTKSQMQCVRRAR